MKPKAALEHYRKHAHPQAKAFVEEAMQLPIQDRHELILHMLLTLGNKMEQQRMAGPTVDGLMRELMQKP